MKKIQSEKTWNKNPIFSRYPCITMNNTIVNCMVIPNPTYQLAISIRSMEGEDRDHKHEPYNDKLNRKLFTKFNGIIH